MTDYNDGKWHGWVGGECPVHPDSIIVVKWRNGVETSDGPASHFIEGHWRDGDIIAFRVVKEHREPREWWVVGDPYGNILHSHSEVPGAFKVREVIEE